MKSDKSKGRFREAFTKEKVMRFLDKQGFYIILFICIAIIGVTAFMTSGNDGKPQELADNEDALEEPGTKADDIDLAKGLDEDKIQIKISDSESQTEEAKEDKAENDEAKDHNAQETKVEDKKNQEEKAKETLASSSSKGGDETKKQEPSKKQESSSKKAGSGNAMIYPVQGNILKKHAMDELVYSNTLKEWTTHPGIDIETSIGAEVKAAMDGTVEEIIEDPLMGISIILDHGNGLKTYYANLSTGNMVTIGQKVEKGQIISGVGRTASSEILDEPHLHFEVRQDGKTVDPHNYIK